MADDFDGDDEGDPPAHKASTGNPPSRQPSADKGNGAKIVPFPGRLSSGAIRPRHDGFTPAKQRNSSRR